MNFDSGLGDGLPLLAPGACQGAYESFAAPIPTGSINPWALEGAFGQGIDCGMIGSLSTMQMYRGPCCAIPQEKPLNRSASMP